MDGLPGLIKKQEAFRRHGHCFSTSGSKDFKKVQCNTVRELPMTSEEIKIKCWGTVL